MRSNWLRSRGFVLRRPATVLAAAALAWAGLVCAGLAGTDAVAPVLVALDPVVGAAVARPATRTPNCTEGECHAKERQFKFLHGPTAVGACDSCHTYADEAKHTFQLRRTERDLCGFCHVGKQVGKFIHKPVADGQCLTCHNPHGAANREMLRAESQGRLCATCHADPAMGRKQVHGPVASGNCATCHNSHASEFPHMLVGEGRSLCLGCHKEMGQQMLKVKLLHKPAEGDCLQCHESHASNHIMQLRAEPLDLCVSCHAQVKDAAQQAPFKHSAVTQGQACLACHTSHGSDRAKLMRREPIAACLSCHDKPVARPGGGTAIASVAEVAQPGLVRHGPIRDGNCSGCHSLHGGWVSRLLSQPYPETFYQPFSVDAYALCFSCHDKQLGLAERTEGLTRFRNGTLNLHYLHVNKPERGRSCYSCHSTHASAQTVHIRNSVPYGNWEIPINFSVTASGGSCAPGCHRATAYDRQNPVPLTGNINPTPAPPQARPPEPPPPPTKNEEKKP